MKRKSPLKTVAGKLVMTGIALFAVVMMIMGIAGCSGETGSADIAKAEAKKEAEKSPLEASDIRSEVENLMKAAMATPESENAWVDYEKASLELKFDDETNPNIIAEKGVNEENINTVKKLLDKNASVLQSVDRGFEKNSFQAYMDYKKGWASRVPNFLKLRTLGYFLAIAGDYELSQGNEQQAAVRYMQCMKLGQGMGNNGSLIFGMIGTAIERIGMKPLKALLSRENVGADTCEYIAGEMEKLDKKHFTITDLLDSEVIYVEYSFNQMMKGEFDDEFMDCKITPEIVSKEREVYRKWYLEAREAVKGNYGECVKKIAALKELPKNTIAEKLVPSISKAYNQYMRNRAEYGGIILLATLKGYKAEKGAYPETLSALVPGCIGEIPRDCFAADGQFIYRAESGKVLFYSVGPDEKDDGGRQAEDRFMENGDMAFINEK